MPGLFRGLSGALSIGVGLLVLLLPETSNQPLPTTVEEIEGWPLSPSGGSGQKECTRGKRADFPSALRDGEVDVTKI